ncbi:repeat 6 [Octopus vulgaris]|uniref:Repeat 6 n=1 Tax=Octopus vulgaris TaxID=6645 RepID=A0AA36BC15_OCTVU|nr:repeat 6 [Octopus vulgaris]
MEKYKTMNIKTSDECELCKVFGTKSKHILSSFINKNTKPVILTSSGEVKPLSFAKKKKLPRYKVFLKKLSETSESNAAPSSKEELEEDTEKTQNYQSNITQVKSTAKSLIEAAEKLCMPKGLKSPAKTRYTATPHQTIPRFSGLAKLKDTWQVSDPDIQNADNQDAFNQKDKSSDLFPKLDLLKTNDQEENMTIHQQILKTISTPISVTKEDILNLKDAFVKVKPKVSEKEEKVSTSMEKSEPQPLNKIKEEIALKSTKIKQFCKITHHNFCGATNEFQIPSPFTKATWKYHTPSKYQTHFPIKSCRESITKNRLPDDDDQTTLTANIMMDCDFKNDLNELDSNAEKLLSELQITIEGNEVPTMLNDDLYFWTLSPPKLNITAKHVKRLMFPLYQQSQASDVLHYRKIDESQQFAPSFSPAPPKEGHMSYALQEGQTVVDSITSGPLVGESSSQLAMSESLAGKETVAEGSADKVPSAVYGASEHEVCPSALGIASSRQPSSAARESVSADDIFSTLRVSTERDEHEKFLSPYDVYSVESFYSGRAPWARSESEYSRSQSSIDLESVLEPPVILEKTLSAGNIFNVEKMLRLRPAAIESEPSYFDVETFAKQRGKPSDLDIDVWIKEIWKTWSGEISPGFKTELLNKTDIYEELKLNHLLQCTFSPKIASDISFDDFLKSAISIEFNITDYQTLMEEIEYLSKKILHSAPPSTDDVYKRGILYLKTGDFEASLEDLNWVIKEDPGYMKAYWHRHLIYIYKASYLLALDDLKVIAEERISYELYMALGLVYAKLEEPANSIDNFSNAIQCNPADDLAYLYRAQLYQMGGYIQAAISDYQNVIDLHPLNSVVILKHATLSMKIRKWNLALADFDMLIEISLNSNYILQRAKIYIELKKFQLALKDLCVAIHLDPNSWEAYYLRAYLLKRNNIKQAITDFSLSLFLNDMQENMSSYYQRGQLYIKLELIHQAISDFLCILQFQPNHVNSLLTLGHIYSRYIQNYKKALMYYTDVINLEPTSIRGYFSRAQVYQKIEQYTDALKDFIIVIHIQPNNYRAYLHLGYLNLKLGNYAMSHAFLSLAAERSSETGIGWTSEMSMVQLFLGNISTALDILKYNITKDPCSIPLLKMLAKVQIADFRYREALQTYFLMKDIMRPEKKTWPEEADDVFYNIGRVHMKLEEYEEAYSAFTQAIKINRNHKDAIYYRGIVKIHLNMCDFIRDFNKSLTSGRRNAQVFLSRACYFGMLKNYPKAILNCNEALEIEPQSIKGLLYRGALKYFIGAYKFAIVDLTEAIKIQRNVAVAYFNRAVCYAAYGKKTKALRDYAIALLIGGKMDYKVYVNRGLLYYSLNDISNAFNDFKSAIKIDGGDHRVFHILGLILHSHSANA